MKSQHFKSLYLYISSLFIFLLHLPFVFAKSKPVVEKSHSGTNVNTILSTRLVNHIKDTLGCLPVNLYDSLHLNLAGMSHQAYDYAIKGFNQLVIAGKITNEKILSIVDFSQSSNKKRLFVIDLDKNKLIYNTYVAHGRNSGKEFARQFSNAPESLQSSLGFYETADTYVGSNGYSLRLEGLESGINDNANRRAIVMHGASYVNEKMANRRGYIGRSWGCPALPEKLHKPIINRIKNGTCLFIFSPDKNYLQKSRLLNI